MMKITEMECLFCESGKLIKMECNSCGVKKIFADNTGNAIWIRNGRIIAAPEDVKAAHERMVSRYGEKYRQK